MKVSEFKPKYNKIELIVSLDKNCLFINLEELFKPVRYSYETIKKKYGNYEILSVKDYNDTKSTSIIIYKEK